MKETIKNVTKIEFAYDERRDKKYDILLVEHSDSEQESPFKLELNQGVALAMKARQDKDDYVYDLEYRYSDSGAADPNFLYKGHTEKTVMGFGSREVVLGWDVLFIGGVDMRDGFSGQEQNMRLGLQSEVFIKSRRDGQPGGYLEITKGRN